MGTIERGLIRKRESQGIHHVLGSLHGIDGTRVGITERVLVGSTINGTRARLAFERVDDI